ncbi:MAG: M20/M25/M40 family metallo-hydrolase, partial [Pseudomonadota bacterium]
AGAQINIVPDSAELDFEIRHLPGEDAEELVARLKAAAERIVEATEDADARIEIEEVNAYPGLDTAVGSEAVGFVKSLTGANGSIKVAFGTEGGLFARDLDVPVVICGPGSMSQGHKPDEFVSLEQLAACDAMLDALLARLRQGL